MAKTQKSLTKSLSVPCLQTIPTVIFGYLGVCLFVCLYPFGRNLKAQMSNLPRECIQHLLTKQEYFVFD